MALAPRAAQGRRFFLLSALTAGLLAGCATGPRVRPRPPVAPGVNRVAVLVPLTGPDSAVGQAIGNAARLAMVDTGSKAFELNVLDTNQGGAMAAANQALAQGSGLILGPLLSEQVGAVAPLARQARVPVIAFSNDTEAAGPGAFILGFTPAQAIDRVVAQAAKGGAKRFAALVPTSVYGQRSARAFQISVQRAGGQVVGIENYASAAAATASAKRVGSRGYDAILIADTPRVAVAVAPAIRSGSRVLGTELWTGANLGRTAKLRGALFAAPPEGRWSQFAQRYKARFGGATPPRIASLGYDAVLLSVRAARNWQPGRRFPLGAIDDSEGFVGVDGTFRFRSDNVAQRAFDVRAVTASGSTLVSPAPASFN